MKPAARQNKAYGKVLFDLGLCSCAPRLVVRQRSSDGSSMMDLHMQKLGELFPLFRRADWQGYWPDFQVVELPAGGVLFTEGDVADGVYFVLSGRFAVQQKTGFVDKRQVVALLAAGSIIGEAALAGQSCRGARIVAVEKSSATLMPVKSFAHLAEQQPSLAIDLLTTLLQISSLRLQKCSERLALVL